MDPPLPVPGGNGDSAFMWRGGIAHWVDACLHVPGGRLTERGFAPSGLRRRVERDELVEREVRRLGDHVEVAGRGVDPIVDAGLAKQPGPGGVLRAERRERARVLVLDRERRAGVD